MCGELDRGNSGYETSKKKVGYDREQTADTVGEGGASSTETYMSHVQNSWREAAASHGGLSSAL